MCTGILGRLLLSSVLLCVPLPAPPPYELLPESVSGDYLGQDPPGPQPALFAPGVLSTCKEHSAAMFSPAGDEVYFGRMFPAVIYCMKRIGGRWTEPFAVPFSGEYNDLYPSISPDGKTVFFSSDRPVEDGGGRLPRGQVRLWMCERTDETWSDPVLLADEINVGRRISAHSMSSSGTLFFTRSEAGTDMYQARGLGKDTMTVEKLAQGLNSQTPDHCPYIAPDESFIIISSFRGGYGLSDLFISFRREDGSWTEPVNMGPTVNSAAKDEYPFVCPDAKYLFFNSNRPSALNERTIPDGPGNIYWVDSGIIEILRKQALGRTSD
jgi:hypothetical protein